MAQRKKRGTETIYAVTIVESALTHDIVHAPMECTHNFMLSIL